MSSRKKKRPQRQNNSKGKAPRPPQQPPAPPSKPELVTKTLTREQTLAVQLVEARSLVQQKNKALADMQKRYSARIRAMAEHISGLEVELEEALSSLMDQYNANESERNSRNIQELGLPIGGGSDEDGLRVFMGPDGLYRYQVYEVPEQDPGQDPDPEEGEEETGESGENGDQETVPEPDEKKEPQPAS